MVVRYCCCEGSPLQGPIVSAKMGCHLSLANFENYPEKTHSNNAHTDSLRQKIYILYSHLYLIGH